MTPRRGDVWLADFDPSVGHEQGGRRPALVLSVDAFNAGAGQLVAVLPITSRPRPNNPFRIEVLPPEGGLSKPSYVICEQVRTISAKRLVKSLGVVSRSALETVAEIVRGLLGL